MTDSGPLSHIRGALQLELLGLHSYLTFKVNTILTIHKLGCSVLVDVFDGCSIPGGSGGRPYDHECAHG